MEYFGVFQGPYFFHAHFISELHWNSHEVGSQGVD
jgi:hypothetical protein